MTESSQMGSSSWRLDGVELTQSSFTLCNSTLLLGGHNVFTSNKTLTRIFNLSMVPHSIITLEFEIYFIDFWDGESLKILVDNNLLKIITPNARTNHYTDICGNYTYDFISSESFEFDHIKPSLNLTLSTQLNGVIQKPMRSWGIRNFKMSFRVQCQLNSVRVNSSYCECKDGFFRNRRTNVIKDGYEGNFNFDCSVCPYPSVKCTTANQATKCLEGFLLKKGLCVLPNGKHKVLFSFFKIN